LVLKSASSPFSIPGVRASIQHTTPSSHDSFGSAEITHPFHPLRGQRFAILAKRVWYGEECLTICPAGLPPQSVPREWTDLRDPNPYDLPGIPHPYVSFEALDRVAVLVELLKKKCNKRRKT
jgi:hypothetical protein